jgi:hypothetical protein
MCQSQCNAVSEVKRNGSEVLEILIKALLDVALFQLVKYVYAQRKIAYICGIVQWKNSGPLFTTFGKRCLLNKY